MKDLRITHVGGPTVLIETAGWTILTDPTFDAPGRRYSFGWGTASNKVVGPALAASALPALDAVLLSHDHHADNLDDAGRALLPDAGAVITTVAGEKRLQDQLGRSVRGLDPWRTTTLDAPGKPSIEITATPCRHGPPLSQPVAGHVIGFSLRWEGQEDGVLWISGDTVLYDGVRQVAERLDVDVAILHLGAVRFGLTGPIRYSMTAAEAVELCGELRPNTAVPVHYEGWSHFSQGRDGIDAALAAASADVRERFRLVPIGEAVDLSA